MSQKPIHHVVPGKTKNGDDEEVSLAASLSSNISAGRHALREEIRQKDFYDENGTLIPNAVQPARVLRPSRHLDEALEFRRRHNLERKKKAQEIKAESARMIASLQPEAVLAALEQKNREHDEEVMVAKFMAGEHWLKNDGVEQHKETDREEKLYNQSVDVLKQSSELQFDFCRAPCGDGRNSTRDKGARACARSAG